MGVYVYSNVDDRVLGFRIVVCHYILAMRHGLFSRLSVDDDDDGADKCFCILTAERRVYLCKNFPYELVKKKNSSKFQLLFSKNE